MPHVWTGHLVQCIWWLHVRMTVPRTSKVSLIVVSFAFAPQHGQGFSLGLLAIVHLGFLFFVLKPGEVLLRK